MSDEQTLAARIAELEATMFRAVEEHDKALRRIAELEAENARLLADAAEPICCCNVGHR